MAEELKKVLYVDDDEIVNEVVTMVLKDVGNFEVMSCSSGKEAIDKVESYAPQLILLDVMMPEMDGVETFQRLQDIPESRGIPCIFLTAKTQSHEQDEYREIGAVGVISKPFDPAMLCKDINEIWSKSCK